MSNKQYNFIAPLEYLKIAGWLGSDWIIAADLKLSTSITIAKKIVNAPFRSSIGEIKSNAIVSGNPFLFATAAYPLEDDSPEAQMNLLNSRLQIAIVFCTILWLIKDNSVNFGQGVLQYPYKASGSRPMISTNSWIAKYTTSDGQLRVTKFSKEEIQEVFKMYRSFYGPVSIADISPSLTPGTVGAIDRLSRAFFYLQAARAMQDFPLKVTNYCTCFEALVSTNNVELTHQVAERVAVLIGKESSDALKIYHNIKKAYGTRSKLVHGAELKDSVEQYRIQSENCDDYLRRTLTAIISNQDTVNLFVRGSTTDIDEFFLKRLLQVNDL